MTSANHPIRVLVDNADSSGVLRPVTFGVPLGRDVMSPATAARLFWQSPTTGAAPTQIDVVEQWSDGSVRWLLVDAMVGGDGEAELVPGVASAGPQVTLTDRGAFVTVDTGELQVEIHRSGSEILRHLTVRSNAVVLDRAALLPYCSVGGQTVGFVVDDLTVESVGPVRATIVVHGRLRASVAGAEDDLDVDVSVNFYAGSSVIDVEIVVTNPAAAAHPGNIWLLGDASSVLLDELGLRIPLAEPTGSYGTIELASGLETTTMAPDEAAYVYQESSGGKRWNSPCHRNRDGVVPMARRGYVATIGQQVLEGLRAEPIVRLDSTRGGIAVCYHEFWQRFPSGLRSDPRSGIDIELLPREFPDQHELQGGEALSGRMTIAISAPGDAVEHLGWARLRPVAHLTPEGYARGQAAPFLTPEAADRNVAYVELVREGLDGPDSLIAKREIIDEYGWRNYGDLWADHEAVFDPEPTTIVSHYNNQYDAIGGFGVWFMRRGSRALLDHMDALARHVADIDVYHTERDTPAYNGGLFWHTMHYVDAGTSTHRSYPSGGGGPSGGHLYASGLLLHHRLTGSLRSAAAVRMLGDHVLDCERGGPGWARLIDRGPSGHATESGADRFHGPGRSPANSVAVLLDAHRLTGEVRYLRRAEVLIRRTIHPDDDVDTRNLLDAEHRWYYTMYLQMLERFLDHKVELDENDLMYAYAHDAFLSYTRWARNHEYPYLDRPEILEFPSETWSAQDMRKHEVFQAAARATSGEEREQFLSRARFFFDESVERLQSADTRTLTRPMVLLLSNGYRRAASDLDYWTIMPLPEPAHRPTEWAPPRVFRPLRDRIRRRATITALFALVGVLGAIGWFSWVT